MLGLAMTHTGLQSYKDNTTFCVSILEPAIKEINKYTELEIFYKYRNDPQNKPSVEFNIKTKLTVDST